jgi:hypothetical protein
MKKIFGLFLISAAALLTAACSDDDNIGKYDGESSVKITSADVLFEARASKGTVEFTAPSAVTVTTGAAWCKAAVEGNKVNVSADTNDDLQGRSAKLVIKCGTDSAFVIVQQKGVLFQLEGFKSSVAAQSNEAQTLTIGYSSNVEVELSSADSWIKPSLADDSHITISVDKNTTGHARFGYVTYKAGGYTNNIKVSQYDFNENFVGPATLFYTKTKDGIETSEATAIASDGSITYKGHTIPLEFNKEECCFYLHAGSLIDTSMSGETKLYMYTTLTDSNYIFWSPTVTMTGNISYDEKNHKTVITFEDNGSAGSAVLCGIALYNFKGEPSADNVQGQVTSSFNWRLER